MVKVLAFALTEGRVAIHCHAGLGRTGVLTACYLVYSLRVSANDAIRYVRLKRPGSVQTRGQILCVRHFAQFILPQTITYYLKEAASKDRYMNEFTLHRFLRRQRIVLHGYEERNFKFIPKIIHCLCERILKLCACSVDKFPPTNIPFTIDFLSAKLHGGLHKRTYSISSISSTSEQFFLSNDFLKSPSSDLSIPSSPNPSEMDDDNDSFSEISTLDGEELSEELLLENRCFQELENQKNFVQDQVEDKPIILDVNEVINALLTNTDTLENATKRKIFQYQHLINSSQIGWASLSIETDIDLLAALLWGWLEGLKTPVINMESFENFVVNYRQPELCLQKLALEDCCLIEYLIRFLMKLQPISKEARENLIKRLIGALSKHSVLINDCLIPSGKGFKRIGDGTFACTLQLFESLFELFEHHHSQISNVYSVDEKSTDNDSDVERFFQ